MGKKERGLFQLGRVNIVLFLLSQRRHFVAIIKWRARHRQIAAINGPIEETLAPYPISLAKQFAKPWESRLIYTLVSLSTGTKIAQGPSVDSALPLSKCQMLHVIKIRSIGRMSEAPRSFANRYCRWNALLINIPYLAITVSKHGVEKV